MLREKNIAVFIDADNCDLSFEHYQNVLNQIRAMGDIVVGNVYGVSEKKHKDIIADAQGQGFEMSFPIRNKKRGAKLFDNRIAIDVVEAVTTSDLIDTVAIVCAPCDLVHLYRLLKKYNVKIAANDNTDEASTHFIDEVLDLGKIDRLKFPQQKAQAKPIPAVAQPAKAKPVEQPKAKPQEKKIDKKAEEDAKITAELLKEIETLRRQNQDAEQKLRQSSTEKAKSESIANEAQDLLKQIDQIRSQKGESQPAQPAAAAQPEEQKRSPSENNDLIRRIEALRNSNDTDDTDELIAKLQSLFDEE